MWCCTPSVCHPFVVEAELIKNGFMFVFERTASRKLLHGEIIFGMKKFCKHHYQVPVAPNFPLPRY